LVKKSSRQARLGALPPKKCRAKARQVQQGGEGGERESIIAVTLEIGAPFAPIKKILSAIRHARYASAAFCV